jgi:hypothetical protein
MVLNAAKIKEGLACALIFHYALMSSLCLIIIVITIFKAIGQISNVKCKKNIKYSLREAKTKFCHEVAKLPNIPEFPGISSNINQAMDQIYNDTSQPKHALTRPQLNLQKL